MRWCDWLFRGPIRNSNMASQWDFSSCLLWRRIKIFEWKFLSVKILIQIESVIFLIGSVFNSMLIINLLRNKHKLVTKSHVYALNSGSKSTKFILRLHWCWWWMLRTKCVGDRFEMLVTDSGFWWPIGYIEKATNITKNIVNIMILPPTSQIGHHHKITNIKMSPTSLSLSSEWGFTEPGSVIK